MNSLQSKRNEDFTVLCAGFYMPFVYMTTGRRFRRFGRTRRYSVVKDLQALGRAESRELAHRATSYVEVTLLWRKLDNALTLRLAEVGTGIEFEFGVRPEDALDAFNHPYAYLPVPKVDSLDLLAV